MKYLLLAILLLIPGCSASHFKTIEIPIPVKSAKINVPPQPHLPIKDLTKNSEPADVVKAYVATVSVQQNYINELKQLLEAD